MSDLVKLHQPNIFRFDATEDAASHLVARDPASESGMLPEEAHPVSHQPLMKAPAGVGRRPSRHPGDHAQSELICFIHDPHQIAFGGKDLRSEVSRGAGSSHEGRGRQDHAGETEGGDLLELRHECLIVRRDIGEGDVARCARRPCTPRIGAFVQKALSREGHLDGRIVRVGSLPRQLVAHADPVDHGFVGRATTLVGVEAPPTDLKTAHEHRLGEAEAHLIGGPVLVDLDLFNEVPDRSARRELHIVENDVKYAVDPVPLGSDLDDDVGSVPLVLKHSEVFVAGIAPIRCEDLSSFRRANELRALREHYEGFVRCVVTPTHIAVGPIRPIGGFRLDPTPVFRGHEGIGVGACAPKK